jgi:3-oxoacyl-[acyl-carrier-protein] synthase-3
MENSLARLAAALDLESTEYLAVRGHGCGNLGLALRVAEDALGSGRHDRILLVLADRAAKQPRIMDSGMSVCSDGAVACVVTRTSEELPHGEIVLHGTSTVTRARPMGRPADRILGSARLAAGAVAQLTAATGLTPERFHHVLFGNYRKGSQRFLTTALRMPQEKLLVGPIADYGHCFSADLLVTFDLYIRDGRLKSGDFVLGSAMGPYSWSAMAFECR